MVKIQLSHNVLGEDNHLREAITYRIPPGRAPSRGAVCGCGAVGRPLLLSRHSDLDPHARDTIASHG